jgi:hypothetical protein
MFSPAHSQSIAASPSRTQGTRLYTSPGPVAKSESRKGNQNGGPNKLQRTYRPRSFPKTSGKNSSKRTSNLVSPPQHQLQDPAHPRWRNLRQPGLLVNSPKQRHSTHRLHHNNRARRINHHPLPLRTRGRAFASTGSQTGQPESAPGERVEVTEISPSHQLTLLQTPSASPAPDPTVQIPALDTPAVRRSASGQVQTGSPVPNEHHAQSVPAPAREDAW